MKFVALLSGGKDSIYSTVQAISNGHELVCGAHLAPRRTNLAEESYMYQTAGSEAVRLQVEECTGVPFYVREISGRSENTSLVYDIANRDGEEGDGSDGVSDEVEDLYLLLKQILIDHPDISAVSSGAILSTYQRTRIEHVCSRLGLTSLSYLWRMSSQRTLLDSILDDGQIDAILVRVACPPGLMPCRHLGKSLRELRDRGILDQLKDRYGMHPAGEGGEYETLVLDCPKLFKLGRLVLEETEIICDESDDGVGILKIVKCSAEKREPQTECMAEKGSGVRQSTPEAHIPKAATSSGATLALDESAVYPAIIQRTSLPNVRMMKGGLCHISALLSPIACNQHDDEAQAAVEEFLSIRDMLQTILSRLYPGDVPETSPRDILYVHLYLSEMSHFAKINEHYQRFFGTHLPPSRSCVAVGKGALPGRRRVMMDCILQRGSGGYLRSDGSGGTGEQCETFLEKALQNKHHSLRTTLHVQSISHWAPVCIGPYSQANVLRSSLVFLAGMIGLVPESMSLIQPSSPGSSGWEVQLHQSWRNAAAVLDGLEDGGGKLDDCLGGLVYFSAGALDSLPSSESSGNVAWHELWATAQCICNDALTNNAGVVVGSVDGTASDNPASDKDPSLYDEDGVLYGGYEDEETWREMAGTAESSDQPPASENYPVPMLMVCLPELPANAEAEVELILASRRAATCLGVSNGSTATSTVPFCNTAQSSDRRILWDTGHDHMNSTTANEDKPSSCVEISSVSRLVGLGCAGISTVVATWRPLQVEANDDSFDFDMEEILSQMIDSSINNAKLNGEMGSLFTIGDMLNVRLYYKAATVSRSDDGDVATVEMADDGSMLRTQLHSVLGMRATQSRSATDTKNKTVDIPAYTVVPVLGMHLSAEKEATSQAGMPFLAMQVTLADCLRMDTEIWARHKREYEYDN